MNKGRVSAYEWAASHPDKLSCIYADNPAIRPGDFARLGELASNDVSLLNVCGSISWRDGKRWYHANTPSPAVPDGLGDEAAIRPIWAADEER